MSQFFQPARKNPFATEHLLSIPYLYQDTSLNELIERFEQMGSRAALVGPEGHGKTTLQETMAAEYERRGVKTHWIRVSRDTPHLPKGIFKQLAEQTAPEDLILFDGVEQISRLAWWRFRRTLKPGQACLITTHTPGWFPTLHDCATDQVLLSEIIARLPISDIQIDSSEIGEIWLKHRGDLRQALFDLYDRYASGEFSLANALPLSE
ncbi:hypothetical protein [Rubinisphaera italica]|uniref:AAA+ ATPase domain-containing protein n=1 Tax=Rubinisphaera italica TaxID=2527969 RepID=A0A5C5XCC4_9PLAN|nr:hypothetical protein [Rubinisphaera italica]TWT60249.1 hypothetical protein Pan54_09630 [Rubinisphaera italica]